jgi:hypothetical protein
VIDQDRAHRRGRHGEELAPALPLDRLVDEFQVRLVHQGRGLERVPGLLIAEDPRRERAQLVVHDRKKVGRGKTL